MACTLTGASPSHPACLLSSTFSSPQVACGNEIKSVVNAVERFNRLKRLEKLNARVRGQFKDFMTQADLKTMREADMPKARR